MRSSTSRASRARAKTSEFNNRLQSAHAACFMASLHVCLDGGHDHINKRIIHEAD
jgi:hypothetical protein